MDTKAMVLAAASMLMEEFTEEGLQVVDLVESLLQTTSTENSRIEGYVTEVVPTYCDITFKSHFRIQKTTVEVRV
jgi:hypothetical protein